MNTFLWTSGHLGWGIFVAVVFSGLWLLVTDLCWRLLTVKTRYLLAWMGSGWLIGISIIVLSYYVLSR